MVMEKEQYNKMLAEESKHVEVLVENDEKTEEIVDSWPMSFDCI